jgi:hypothetical protein
MVAIYVDLQYDQARIFVVYNYFWTKHIFVHMHVGIHSGYTLL